MAALTVVAKISAMHVITAMTARAGFAEFNSTGHRARVTSFALKVKVRAIDLEPGLLVVIEFPE
jgi:hypothetical protein